MEENSHQIKNILNDKENGQIIITFRNSTTEYYHYCWLRDNCRCKVCYHAAINQRLKHILEVPSDIKPSYIEDEGEYYMKIKWQDEHVSGYSSKFLYECSYENWKKSRTLHKILWMGNSVPNNIAYVERDDFLNSESAVKKLLQSLLLYGVAFVDNVKPTMEDTELIINRVAPPQRTLFGDMWKFTSNLDRADTAYTNIPLAPHTDGTYLVESPGLQILHCVEHDGTGGASIALDGFYAAHLMQNNNPEYYKTLCEELQPAKYEEEGWSQYNCDSVLITDKLTHELLQVRYNVYDRTPHCVSSNPKKVVQMHEALREFGRICDSDDVKWTFKLNPGRVFFFDNWRVLHGRTGFTGHRVLCGSYIARGDWLSAARIKGLID